MYHLSFSEENTAVNHFGEQLIAAGYNYYGNEPMYSGITGQEFAADIYLGVVYYQRLRHMVDDKYQVRTTGPVDPKTRQPVKVSQSKDFLQYLTLTYALYRVENVLEEFGLVRWNVMLSSPTERPTSSKID